MNIKLTVTTLISTLYLSLTTINAQQLPYKKQINWDEAIYSPWVNSQIESMTLDEMIGQLFWIGAPLNASTSNLASTISMIDKYKPGGVLFFKNTPENIANVTNTLQQHSKVPLLMSIDGEWGLGMRLQGAVSFPFQMTLGAIQHNQLIEEMGYEIGLQFCRIGLHINLAPVADINTNPANPIIGRRSFGESPYMVANKTTSYMLGLQNAGVPAVAKHFPGHGDTSGDSHKLLPISNHTRARLDSVELVPFRALINAGIMGIMSAHIEVPSLEQKQGLPATLSHKTITQLLKKEMEFKGFAISDAMNMYGVTASSKDGNIDMRALMAGNDIIEMSINLHKAFAEIKNAINNGEMSLKDIEMKCRKTLALKEWCGLNNFNPVKTTGIDNFINRPYTQWLNQRLYNAAVTTIKNDNSFFPIGNNKTVIIQPTAVSGVYNHISNKNNIRLLASSGMSAKQIINNIDKNEKVVIVLEKPTDMGNDTLNAIISQRSTAVIYLGNPYLLNRWPSIKNADAVVLQYENNLMAQKSVAAFISGGISATGRIPVSAGAFNCGEGIDVFRIAK